VGHSRSAENVGSALAHGTIAVQAMDIDTERLQAALANLIATAAPQRRGAVRKRRRYNPSGYSARVRLCLLTLRWDSGNGTIIPE